jgi:hypothetical protein
VGADIDSLRLHQIPPERLQQAVSSHEIGHDELLRTIDGSIHVGFSSKVHHRINLMFTQHFSNQGHVSDVSLDENMPFITVQIGQARAIACVCQEIQGYDPINDDSKFIGSIPQKVMHQV